jgi:hypothetical protein
MRGEKPHGYAHDSVCAYARRRDKTGLEVPDDRLCNAQTLCDCEAQMMLTDLGPATGQV